MTERKNLKITEADYEQLKQEKPDGVTWGYYLTEMRTLD